MNKNNFAIVSLFAGAGGLDEGFKQSGWNIDLAIEIDSDACLTYKSNHQNTIVWNRDIKTVSGSEIKSIIGEKKIILLGGSPCQSFSIFQDELLGKKGIKDERGQLIFEYLRLVEELNPEIIVFENVKNLISDEHLPAFNLFLNRLRKSVGLIMHYRIMQAFEYGVAQIRERVIVIGTKSNLNPFDYIPKLSGPKTLKEALHNCPDSDFFHFKKEYKDVMKYIKEGQCWNVLPPNIAFKVMKKDYRGICLQCNFSFKGQITCPRCGSNHIRNGYGITSYLRRLSYNKPSPTICAVPSSKIHGLMAHPAENRALSIREAARIQSFPDGYKFFGDIFSQQRQIGNAVPPQMAKAIGIGINNILNISANSLCKEKETIRWILNHQHANQLSELEKDLVRTTIKKIRSGNKLPNKYYLYLKEILVKLRNLSIIKIS